MVRSGDKERRDSNWAILRKETCCYSHRCRVAKAYNLPMGARPPGLQRCYVPYFIPYPTCVFISNPAYASWVARAIAAAGTSDENEHFVSDKPVLRCMYRIMAHSAACIDLCEVLYILIVKNILYDKFLWFKLTTKIFNNRNFLNYGIDVWMCVIHSHFICLTIGTDHPLSISYHDMQTMKHCSYQ